MHNKYILNDVIHTIFSLAKIERKEVNPSKADKFTRATIRGDIDDVVWQKSPMNIDEVGVLTDALSQS